MTAAPRAELSPLAAREATLAALTEQQARFGGGAARERQLSRLRSGSGAVVTGQQLGLFGGPAYTVYKAATAVVEARRRDAVPIFWLQSEDHDFEEVRRCTVLDACGDRVTVELPGDPSRISMAHRSVDGSVSTALGRLAAACEEAPHREATLERMKAAFEPGRAWVDAFGRLLAGLFEDLLFLDPRTPAMAKVAGPLHRWAIERADELDDLLEQRVAALGAAQVPVRRGCLLSFFHAAGPGSPRHRPERDGEGYRWPGLDTPVSRSHLIEALDREPLSWSTSALLRPVLQDLALPTVAYVCGPSERHYLEQVKPLYDALDLRAPDAVARARFVVTDAPCRRRLKALGLAARDAEQPESTLLDALGDAPGPDGESVRQRLSGSLRAELDRLAPELRAIDRGLARAVDRTTRHVDRGLSQLARRVDDARRRRDEVLTDRLAFVKARLCPGGVPQERVLGLPHFAAWHGAEAFVQSVIEAVGDDRTLKELSL